MAVSLAFVASGAGHAQDKISLGDKPNYEFKSSPYNGCGVKSLADLRGAPTLIEFWGIR